MTGIQILNELIKQRVDAAMANQELVAWTLSPDAFVRLKMDVHNSAVIAELEGRSDFVFVEGVPAYLNTQQRSEIIPWRDEAMMWKETGIS